MRGKRGGDALGSMGEGDGEKTETDASENDDISFPNTIIYEVSLIFCLFLDNGDWDKNSIEVFIDFLLDPY